MPWTCPNNCHSNEPAWCVERWESPADLILHFYAADDKELETEIRPVKVHSDCNPKYDNTTHCTVCDAYVEWLDPTDTLKSETSTS